MCCVSIGLCHHAFPVLGVVYNPFLDELYSAYQGGGAWLNEIVPLPLQQAARPLVTLQHALIGFDCLSLSSPPYLQRDMGRPNSSFVSRGDG